MKTVTKLFALAGIALAIFTTSSSYAQTTTMTPMSTSPGMAFKVGVGINGGLFRGGSPMEYAYGADLKLQYDLSPYVAITASGGYTKLMGRNNVLDVDFIPVKGGVRVFPIHRMYIATEMGAGLAIQDGAKTNYIYTGGFGYEWNNGLDVGVRYEGYVNNSASTTYFRKTGQYALRIGYNFKL